MFTSVLVECLCERRRRRRNALQEGQRGGCQEAFSIHTLGKMDGVKEGLRIVHADMFAFVCDG